MTNPSFDPIPAGYRQLLPGEILETGDMYYNYQGPHWTYTMRIGDAVKASDNFTYVRKVVKR